MALELYAHPFSSYCQKVLVALYENAIDFEYRPLTPEQPQNMARLAELWPMRRFPLLVDNGETVVESSIIIEHLQNRHPGPVRLIPDDPARALEVRFLDRFFDLYVSTPQQKCVFDALRPAEQRDSLGVEDARQMLRTAYAWLERRWPEGPGRLATSSAWLTAPRRPFCSTPTGPNRSPRPSASYATIANACCKDPRSPAPSTRRGLTARSFR